MKSTSKANTKMIFAHLCDQMKKLSAGAISVEEAKGQANLAKQATNLLNYELSKSIAVAKWGDDIEVNDIEE